MVTAAFPGDGTDDFIAMPLYDIINDVTIYGIDVAILDGSEDGTPIRGFLVDMLDDLALTEQYGGELISSAEVDMATGYTNSGEGDIVWYTLAGRALTKLLRATGSALRLSTTVVPTSKSARRSTPTTKLRLCTVLSAAERPTTGTTATRCPWCA